MNWKIEWLDIALSTQSELKTRYQNGQAQAGSVLATLSQTAGFGRKQRDWVAPVGNLSVSFLFTTDRTDTAYQCNLLASLILCQCLEELDAKLACRVKWPNDVWCNNKKLAGILSEALPNNHVLMGIGINLNSSISDFPNELRSSIQTVQDVLGAPVSPKFFLDSFLQAFARALPNFEKNGLRDFLPLIQDRLQFHNQDVFLSETDNSETGRGKLVGLDENGLLILQSASQPPQKYISGDLSLRRCS